MDTQNDKELIDKLKEICRAASRAGKEEAKKKFRRFYNEAAQSANPPKNIYSAILTPRWEGYHFKDFVNTLIAQCSKKAQGDILAVILKSTGKDLEDFNKTPGDKGIPEGKSLALFRGLAKLQEQSEAEITLSFLQFCEGKVLSIFFDETLDDAEEQAIKDLSDFLSQYRKIPPNPYKGLEPFTAEDSDFFFGRDALIQSICAALQHQPILALIGASGLGKSSLMNAGVAKVLEQNDCLFIEFRPSDGTGNDPFFALACAIVANYSTAELTTDLAIEQEKTAEALKHGKLALTTCIDLIRDETPQKIIIYIDQFEELFTLQQPQEDIDSFIDMLVVFYHSVSKNEPIQAAIAFSIRSDFTGYINAYRDFTDILSANNDINIYPPSKEDLRCAIEEPAKKSQVKFEEGLVELILDDASKSKNALPLVAFVLKELWGTQQERTIRFVDYHKTGGVSGALTQRTEEKYKALSAREQRRAEHVFTALVDTNKGYIDTKRIARQNEFDADDWQLIQKLANEEHRLLIVDSSQKTENLATVELVHETLISQWGRLQQWLEAHRIFRVWRNELSTRMTIWLENKSDTANLLKGDALAQARQEFKKYSSKLLDDEKAFIEASIKDHEATKRKQRSFVVALACIAAIFIGLGYFLNLARNDANLQRKNAIEANDKAQTNLRRFIVEKAEKLSEQEQNRLAVLLALDVLPESSLIDEDFLENDYAKKALDILKNTLREYIEMSKIEADGVIKHFEASADARSVVTVTKEGRISTWSTNSGIKKLDFKTGWQNISLVKYSADDSKILLTIKGESLRVLDVHTGKSIAVLNGIFRNAELSPDGSVLVTESEDSTVNIWQINTSNTSPLSTYHNMASWRDSKFHASEITGNFWLTTPKKLKHMQFGNSSFSEDQEWNRERFRFIQPSPSGKHVFLLTENNEIKAGQLNNLDKPSLLLNLEIENKKNVIKDILANPEWRIHFNELDNSIIFSSPFDNFQSFDVQTGKRLNKLNQYNQNVTSTISSSDGSKLLFDSGESPLIDYYGENRLQTNNQRLPKSDDFISEYENRPADVKAKFAGKSNIVVTWNSVEPKRVKLWNPNIYPSHRVLRSLSSKVTCVHFSRFSTLVAICENGQIKIWELNSGRLVHTLKGDSDNERVVYFSKDNSKVVTASDKTIKLWELKAERVIFQADNELSLRVALLSDDEKSILSYFSLIHGGLYPFIAVHETNINISEASDTPKRISLPPLKIQTDDSFTYERVKALVSTIASRYSDFITNMTQTHPRSPFFYQPNRLIFSNDGKLAVIATVKQSNASAILPRDSEFISQGIIVYNTLNDVIIQKIIPKAAHKITMISPNNETLVTFSQNQYHIWDIKSGEVIRRFPSNWQSLGNEAISDDGKLFVSLLNNLINVWEIETGKLIFQYERNSHNIGSVKISQDSKTIAWHEYSNNRNSGNIIIAPIEQVSGNQIVEHYRKLRIHPLTKRERERYLVSH